MKPLDIALEDCNEHAVRILAPLTEDLNIAEETRNHSAYIGNEKFLACLVILLVKFDQLLQKILCFK